MSKSRFSKSTVINAPKEAVFKWHSTPGAIERLSPPWDPLKVLYLSGGIEKEAEVTLGMKAGPFPYKWFARHTDYRENEFFRDEQIKGPFSEWIHTHRFEPDGENRCVLENSIEYRLPFHYASKFLTQKAINKKLERIFAYRHKITANDVLLHHSNNKIKPMAILILCLGGKIGSGRQYISWIDMEDIIGAIYHSLTSMDIAGPVNVVSPNPVTNLQFAKSLGRILSRPTPFSLPAFAIKLGFGQMGREILLSSTRVKPEVLIEAGYCFKNPDIDKALRQMLGKREL